MTIPAPLSAESGHLFVVHGDLTRLACDALVLPCDSVCDVNDAWRPVLPPGLVSSAHRGRTRVSVPLTDGFAVVPGTSDPRVALVATVRPRGGLHEIVAGVCHAAASVATGTITHQGRVRPLIGLPLVLTGQGGMDGRRGEVLAALVPSLRDLARTSDFDVALVFNDRRDAAAAQATRRPEDFLLEERLVVEADRLGRLAADRELSLFVGAGASVPVGLPSWTGLIRELQRAAGRPPGSPIKEDVDWLMQEAESLQRELGKPTYFKEMTSLLQVRRHAVGHALLAGLGSDRMVTTNFDNCLELALSAVHGSPDRFRVLARAVAVGALPWLLKLHGDIERPESLVLTKSEYDAFQHEQQALLGVVEGLMLTSHLLFVGYGLSDVEFLELANGVRKVRRRADDGGNSTVGTALALHPTAIDRKRWAEDLTVVSMSGDAKDPEGARTLEIFLDRMVWTAARSRASREYFLDPRYDAAFVAPEDVALRGSLHAFLDGLPAIAREADAWPVLRGVLRDLGADL